MKKLFFLILVLSPFICGQITHYSTIAPGDTVGNAIYLGKNEIPSGVFVDSLSTIPSTLKFYVFFGDTAGYGTTLYMWYPVTAQNDGSTLYTCTADTNSFTALNPAAFYPLIANPYLTMGDKAGRVYLKVVVSLGTTKHTIIGIKTRTYTELGQ